MDVGFIHNASSSLPQSIDHRGAAVSFPGTGKAETPFLFAKENKLADQVRAEMMMNLKEMQNFLYMLVGSKLRVQSEKDAIGSSINTAA